VKRTTTTQLILILAIVQFNSFGWTQESPDSLPAAKLGVALDKPQEEFDIDFSGGSISEYVAFLRTCPNFDNEMKPARVNIVVTDSAKNFQLPEIKVNTNMDGALGLLEGCSTDNSHIVVQPDPSGNVTMITVESNEAPSVTVINAKQLLLEVPMEDLLEVIDLGLTMQGNTTKVELKLHEKTGLIFAKGMRSGTQLVLDIVDELDEKSNRHRAGAGMMSGFGDGAGPGGFGGGAPGGSGKFSGGGGGGMGMGMGAGGPNTGKRTGGMPGGGTTLPRDKGKVIKSP
jgi:hypothetical protein